MPKFPRGRKPPPKKQKKSEPAESQPGPSRPRRTDDENPDDRLHGSAPQKPPKPKGPQTLSIAQYVQEMVMLHIKETSATSMKAVSEYIRKSAAAQKRIRRITTKSSQKGRPGRLLPEPLAQPKPSSSGTTLTPVVGEGGVVINDEVIRNAVMAAYDGLWKYTSNQNNRIKIVACHLDVSAKHIRDIVQLGLKIRAAAEKREKERNAEAENVAENVSESVDQPQEEGASDEAAEAANVAETFDSSDESMDVLEEEEDAGGDKEEATSSDEEMQQ